MAIDTRIGISYRSVLSRHSGKR